MFVIAGSGHGKLGGALAKELGAKVCGVINRHFADGERYIRLLEKVKGSRVIIVQNTFPDENVVEMLLLLEAAREAGAKEVRAVIPYMGYSRQERTFRDGEAVSSRAIGSAIGAMCDSVYTISVHAPRVLDFFGVPSQDISGTRAAAEYLQKNGVDLIVAPDEGARARCEEAAELLGVDCYVMSKNRIDDRNVEITMGDLNPEGKNIVILDDIISTGGTIATSAKMLKDGGAASVSAVCTHGLFIEDAANRLRVCDELMCSDTIEGVHTRYSVSSVIAEALK